LTGFFLLRIVSWKIGKRSILGLSLKCKAHSLKKDEAIMEKLQYGNWIRRNILWLLGLSSLALLMLTLLPLPAGVRMVSGVLGAAIWASFLYPLYSYAMFSPRGGNMQEKFYDLILEYVEKNCTGKVLDIGTGNGILAIKAAVRYPAAQVTGVDMWGADWEYSKSICAQNARIACVAERIEFKKGDAASLNYADETFDIVISNLTFHEVKLVKHKSDVMREALRLVKQGGSFAFIDYFYEERYYGKTPAFELLLGKLKLEQVELKRLQDVLVFPGLLRHPRALGKIGIVYGKK
jgi:SAM-dependent methyltransferase